MDQTLRQFFVDGGVPEEQIDDVIQKLGVQKLDDMRYITQPSVYEKAGVKTIFSQQKLSANARELANNIKAEQTKLTTNVDDDLLVASIADKDWFADIEQRGILLFDNVTYIAGLKAMIAANLGVFASVEKLMGAVNDYAVKNARPAPQLFYDLQNIVMRRFFGMPLAIVQDQEYKGIPIYATTAELNQLIQRIQTILVPSIMDSVAKLERWNTDLSKQKTQDYFVQRSIGGKNVSYPSPVALYEAGKALRLSINQTFAGNGIQKAMALYHEYKAFIEVLNNPSLPNSIGAVDKDSVLSFLGFDKANSAAVRSEPLIVQYVINLIQADEQSIGEKELHFFRALFNLSRQIDWSILTNTLDATSGRSQIVNDTSAEAEEDDDLDLSSQLGFTTNNGLIEMDGDGIVTAN